MQFVVGQREPILLNRRNDENAQLRRLAADGLVRLEHWKDTKQLFSRQSEQQKIYTDRLDEELDIIINMGFPAIF